MSVCVKAGDRTTWTKEEGTYIRDRLLAVWKMSRKMRTHLLCTLGTAAHSPSSWWQTLHGEVVFLESFVKKFMDKVYMIQGPRSLVLLNMSSMPCTLYMYIIHGEKGDDNSEYF